MHTAENHRLRFPSGFQTSKCRVLGNEGGILPTAVTEFAVRLVTWLPGCRVSTCAKGILHEAFLAWLVRFSRFPFYPYRVVPFAVGRVPVDWGVEFPSRVDPWPVGLRRGEDRSRLHKRSSLVPRSSLARRGTRRPAERDRHTPVLPNGQPQYARWLLWLS